MGDSNGLVLPYFLCGVSIFSYNYLFIDYNGKILIINGSDFHVFQFQSYQVNGAIRDNDL